MNTQPQNAGAPKEDYLDKGISLRVFLPLMSSPPAKPSLALLSSYSGKPLANAVRRS